MQASARSEGEVRWNQKWITVSDDSNYLRSQSYGEQSMTTTEESSQAADTIEVRALRQLLLEKTAAVETMRTMLMRSEHAHRLSISGMSKCISQQQHIIEANAAALAELSAKFAQDAKFIGETLAKYLNDPQPPSEALQGEIGPGFYVRPAEHRDPVYIGEDGHPYINVADLDMDEDDL
jgi:hypothetical protein